MNHQTSKSLSAPVVRILTAAILLTSGSGVAWAETISSPLGNFEVGIQTLGNLYDPVAQVGFRRVVDDYDPIRPFTPREAYGVSGNANSGVVDPNNDPGTVLNMVLTGSNFTPNSAFKATVLRVAGVDILQVDQRYTFLAENVLQISTQISNLSNSVQSVLFSRNVDWDIAPSETIETITASPLVLPVIDGSYDGFEDPDPLVPFEFSTTVGGGEFGPGDLGAGLRINLGTLQPVTAPDNERRTHFSIFYAIGDVGQTEAQLRAQLGFTGGSDRINSAAIGFVFGNGLVPTTLISGAAFVPEPSSAALLAIGGLGMLACGLSTKVRRMFAVRSSTEAA